MSFGRRAAAFSLLLAAAGRVHASDALSPVVSDMKGQGFSVSQRVAQDLDGVPITAIVFHHEEGDYDQLNAYATLKGRPIMTFTHATAGERLKFDPSLSAGRFPDLWKDGSRLLVYEAFHPALNRRTLNILRYEKLRFKRLAAFDEAELSDLDGDGRPEVVATAFPLGRSFHIACSSYETTVSGAARTEILARGGKGFVPASSRHKEFYARRIAREEESLRLLAPRREERPGDFMSQALTLFYDYSARGEKRRGWERLLALGELPAGTPAALVACRDRLKAEYRPKLSIPKDWP